MKAIILAGGSGTKLWPYSETMPKATIPVANKPVIQILVEELKKYDLDIYAIVGYLKEDIKYALKDFSNINYIEIDKQHGTAKALIDSLKSIPQDDILVLYGDIVLHPKDLERFIEKSEGLRLTSLVSPLGKEEPQDWICSSINNGKITSIEGHPRSGFYRMCGVYFIGKEYLQYLEKTPNFMRNIPVGGMPPQEIELAQSFQVMIEQGLNIYAVETEGFFVDIDKPWHILEANRRYIEFLSGSIRENIIPENSTISQDAYIKGKVVLGKNSHIGPRVVIMDNLIVGDNTTITNGAIFTGPAIVGNNCFIYSYPQVGAYTSIGNRCHIGHCAEIEGVFFENVYVVHYSELYGVFGYSVDIGAATVCGTLRFDDRYTTHRIKDRVEFPKEGANATYIGNFSRTGVNAIIMPGVKVGCYSLVGPGVIAYEDIPSNTLILAKQEYIKKPWGPERYGW
ncbi:MAG: sugar phosphate nucleotidyltransferase [bacterium]|nr:sugar phosphate nucleotidyltransferase [bacterium]